MAEETHTETVETVAADSAQLAANAAEAAQLAAAQTMEHAQIAVAGVTQQAATEIAQTEERLAEWQSSQAKLLEQLASRVAGHEQATEARLKETTDQLSLILSRLEAQQAPQQSPETNPGEGAPPAPEPEAPRRRAHRWT
jgi:hypothetical protein